MASSSRTSRPATSAESRTVDMLNLGVLLTTLRASMRRQQREPRGAVFRGPFTLPTDVLLDETVSTQGIVLKRPEGASGMPMMLEANSGRSAKSSCGRDERHCRSPTSVPDGDHRPCAREEKGVKLVGEAGFEGLATRAGPAPGRTRPASLVRRGAWRDCGDTSGFPLRSATRRRDRFPLPHRNARIRRVKWGRGGGI